MSHENAMTSGSPSTNDLNGRKILVALTGGIACYKTAPLVSRLVQNGAQVRVIMTSSATQFITPLTFQSLTGHRVLTSIWETDDRPDSQHIGLARWCDTFIIAPASANTLARIANGLCDDIVSLVASALPHDAADAPRALFAPAMNADMWANPIVQRNVAMIRDMLGWKQVGPNDGWQACRTKGAGRMAEADEIYDAAMRP